MRIMCCVIAALMLGGCLARAAVDVVTLPVRAVGAGVDAMTTSQEEADRNRGREIRKQEEREAKEARRAEKERRRAERDARRDDEDY
jgi:outer membrane murein-binding lipoprotein Lpp